MNQISRKPATNRPLGAQTSKASKFTERRDALRILVALVFIALASVTSLDQGTLLEVRNPQTLTEAAPNKDANGNTERPSWARLLLEALHRIV